MDIREWALVVFTLLAQAAVGAFIVLGVVHFFAARKAGMEEADRLSDRALLAIGPPLILGIGASLGHLGYPLHAYFSVTHLGSSWLSREILSVLLFAAIGFVFALMQWFKIGPFALRRVVAWIAALIGIGLVYVMSRIYMQRTVPVWNNLMPPVYFYTTAFLLGTLAVGVAFVVNYAFVERKNPESADTQRMLLRGSLRWLAIAAIFLLGVEFMTVPLYVAYLGSSPATAPAAALLTHQYVLVLAFRLGLVFIGAGILATFLHRLSLSPGREKIMGNLTYAAFGLVLASEVLGRFLYYAIRMRIGT
jgi:anaerobic dimethyl sulfoxide reductase subunit C (anchor subunit)